MKLTFIFFVLQLLTSHDLGVLDIS